MAGIESRLYYSRGRLVEKESSQSRFQYPKLP